MTELGSENEQLLRAYRLCFNSPAGQTVLLDLMKFCKFRVPIDSQVDEGMRRVFLRIENFLNLAPEQLAMLYRGQSFLAPTGETTDG